MTEVHKFLRLKKIAMSRKVNDANIYTPLTFLVSKIGLITLVA